MIFRILAAFTILIASTLVSAWILLPIALLHALAWFGLELIIIATLIDVYFGAGSVVPYYTLAAVVIVAVAEWVKPRLSFYS